MTENEPLTGAVPNDPEEGPRSAGPSQPDPWTDVVRSLDELGRAMSAWGAAVREDPENRRRMKELQGQFESMARQIGDAADAAVKSDVAKQMGSAVMATGEVMIGTAKRVTDEVSPYVASAFRTAAETIRGAAQRIEKRADETRQTAEPATPPGPAPEPAPYCGEEPPAPAPSGTGEDYVP